MSRPVSLEKFRALVDTAILQFIAQGYQRTQVADIAAHMGIANGTVYTYVESKEALFDLAVRHADAPLPDRLPDRLPVPTPPPGSTASEVQRVLAERAIFPRLAAALNGALPREIAAELRGIVEEIYDLLATNRKGLKLIDRCAADYPELGAIWFAAGRGGLVTLIHTYLVRRNAVLRPIADPTITARMVLEVLVLWAVHRHYDPRPQPMDEDAARNEAVTFVTSALGVAS